MAGLRRALGLVLRVLGTDFTDYTDCFQGVVRLDTVMPGLFSTAFVRGVCFGFSSERDRRI